jgi:hypothetical protein
VNVTTTALPLSVFTNWLAGGERGLSSEGIVSHLTGQRIGSTRWPSAAWSYHPLDPDDFRRCQLLVEQVPLARLMFPAMRTASPVWERLVDAWDEIHEAIEAEVPDYVHTRSHAPARLGYQVMKRVIAGGDICGTCKGSGHAEPCPKCKGSGRRSGGRCRAPGCDRGHFRCRTCRGYGYTGGER